MTDERLRDAFAELRRSEATRAPRFERLWHVEPALSRLRAGSTSHRRSAAVAFAMLLLIAIVTVAVLHRPRQTPQPTISAWRAPTDFLLNTPGRELLNSVPDLKGKLQ